MDGWATKFTDFQFLLGGGGREPSGGAARAESCNCNVRRDGVKCGMVRKDGRQLSSTRLANAASSRHFNAHCGTKYKHT